MLVSEIKRDSIDAVGDNITDVYAKSPPHYAIYRTEERVMVHVADDQDEAQRQGALLAPLNPPRGEIYGLIDGWRSSSRAGVKARVKCYDRRIADALSMALQKDVSGASAVLANIKTDLLDERTAWARFEYLIAASLVSATIVALAWGLITWLAPQAAMKGLSAAFAAGTVGAFFSIAIAIRSRTVLTDLYRVSNTADAVLRVLIGAIAALVLVSLVYLGVINVVLGDGGQVSADKQDTHAWLFVLAVAFLAGFSERLVPDLLERSTATTRPPPASTAAGLGAASAAGAAAAVPAMVANTMDVGPAQQDAENELDHCLCDHGVGDDEATLDVALPIAVGGIASPRTSIGTESSKAA